MLCFTFCVLHAYKANHRRMSDLWPSYLILNMQSTKQRASEKKSWHLSAHFLDGVKFWCQNPLSSQNFSSKNEKKIRRKKYFLSTAGRLIFGNAIKYFCDASRYALYKEDLAQQQKFPFKWFELWGNSLLPKLYNMEGISP